MDNIKLIATDLDRTYIKKMFTDDVSEYACEVLEKVLDKGLYFIPCSARSIKIMPKQLKENHRIEYYITGNGSAVYYRDQILFSNHLTCEKTIEILNAAKAQNIHWTLSIDGIYYSNRQILNDVDKLNISESYLKVLHDTRVFIDDYLEVVKPGVCVEKLHFITYQGNGKKELHEAFEGIEGILVTESSINNVEVLHYCAGKGAALLQLMEYLNINKDEAIAFGDNENDKSMFMVVSHRCAVENATEGLKEIANLRCESHELDGVSEFIEKYIL